MKILKLELLEAFLSEDPVVVDVRPAGQYVAGDFEGAIHVPLLDIQQGKHQLAMGRPILLLCERGVMSELAGLYLEAAGYNQIWNLEGGLGKLRKNKSGM